MLDPDRPFEMETPTQYHRPPIEDLMSAYDIDEEQMLKPNIDLPPTKRDPLLSRVWHKEVGPPPGSELSQTVQDPDDMRPITHMPFAGDFAEVLVDPDQAKP
mmetsp:Transcript_18637/g.27884  ORF Transcript_18637/g.27884 Transcript_18637/m.27884 type:complete len:102 (+) Transcript_18637:233-538(+)